MDSYTSQQGGDHKPNERRELFELLTEAIPSWSRPIYGLFRINGLQYLIHRAVKAQATDKLSVAQHKT
jgi:hypothetical protein